MTDSVFFLGIALIVAWFWIRDPQASYKQRLNRAFIMAIVIGLCVASFF